MWLEGIFATQMPRSIALGLKATRPVIKQKSNRGMREKNMGWHSFSFFKSHNFFEINYISDF